MSRLNQFLPKAVSSRVKPRETETTPLAILEFQSPTAAIIATPLPRMASYTNWFVSALVVSLLVAGSVMPTDKLVEANGTLVSAVPDITVQAFNTESIVEKINVNPGQLVTKGQVLATLNPTYATADLTSLTQQQQQYSAQVAELRAQENGLPYFGDPTNPASALQLQTYNQQLGQYRYTMDGYNAKINQDQTVLAGYQAQIDYYQQRLGIAKNVESMRKDLQQLQVGSKLDTLSATDDRVNIQSELASAISSADAQKRQLAYDEAQRDGFNQQWKASISQQLGQAIVNLTQTQQQLTKAQLNDQLIVLTAPDDAIVQSVAQVAVGSILQSGQPLMDLAPVDAPLTVQADISGNESGYVHVGDPVVIKFDTLPFTQFGSAKGTVVSISPESVNPLNQQAMAAYGPPTPGAPQTLYYVADISLDVLNLHNTPPGFRLVPGMPLEADTQVGTRTIMEFLLERMLPVAYDSMHEP